MLQQDIERAVRDALSEDLGGTLIPMPTLLPSWIPEHKEEKCYVITREAGGVFWWQGLGRRGVCATGGQVKVEWQVEAMAIGVADSGTVPSAGPARLCSPASALYSICAEPPVWPAHRPLYKR